MADRDGDPFDALAVRRGHFMLESGLHADRWVALDAWLVDPAAIAPSIATLAALLSAHGPTAICGPLTGGAFVAQAVAMRTGLRFYFTERVAATGTTPADALFGARYALPPDLRARASVERFAVVDDVVSAGSSVRATIDALVEAGAAIAVVGALAVLGERAVTHCAAIGVPLVANRFAPFDAWAPADCPLCAEGVPLDRPR